MTSAPTSSTEMPKAYDPRDTETRWYAFWESHGHFHANAEPSDTREPYTIVMPPPNVTGSLHMGHACRTTFEDVLVRYARMSGKNALWVPGTDHAGIATQTVVERQLKREGKSRHDIGRDAFVERVWKWKGESGGRILSQLRVMGASCDWQRALFTMDEGPSRAVREVFVRLYEEGLIYRATRLIQWCVECRTALSDLEVETEENVQGELFEFAYPVEGGGELVVATTRPETMLGDTAVAVHPDDPRYTHLHGKFVTHPFLTRRIPIITDAVLVDPKFGTGVVKVTPAHDPNDFQTGKRHKLDEINILNLDGTLNAEAGPFAGMERFKARKAVKAKLEELGLVRGTKAHVMTLPRCQRCNTVVEPLISTQWFVKMEPLVKPAIDVVESGRVQIIPEDWSKTYFHFMRNIQDWCISRQLWWGHPIPAWHCGHCSKITVSRTTPTTCTHCQSDKLTQDPDVLDTWFSSALWPFSTLGWPDKTPELARFYPTQDMETGYDILFFWVARMIVMGLHFMGDVPFKRVLLSGLVTDERGEKMSKVKGNVIDPLDVIHGATLDSLVQKAEQGGAKPSGIEYLRKTYPEGFQAFGADALRMTLLSYSPQTRRIALSIKRIEGYRNFANKLWNAARYTLGKLEGTGVAANHERPAAAHVANRWILSRLDAALLVAHRGFAEYRVDDSSGALYHFVWDELCDWYLELTKPLLESKDDALVLETRRVLAHVMEATLRALHPMMPFITEEIWQRWPKTTPTGACIVAPYPKVGREGAPDEHAEAEMATLQSVIVAVRTIRAEHDLPPSKPIPLVLRTDDASKRAVLEREIVSITALCRAERLVFESATTAEVPAQTAVSVAGGVTVLVPLAGLVDVAKERERLTRELAKTKKDHEAVDKKLANKGFVDRAPADVVAAERARLAQLTESVARLEAALGKLGVA